MCKKFADSENPAVSVFWVLWFVTIMGSDCMRPDNQVADTPAELQVPGLHKVHGLHISF